MFYFILLFLLSVSNSSKLCVNCRYFMPCDSSASFSKCSQFPLSKISTNFLVTGNPDYISSNYYYCSSARSNENMCGTNGTKYKKKYTYKNKLTKIDLYNKDEA